MRVLLLVGLAAFAGLSWVLSFQASRLRDLAERVGALEPRRFERLTLITAGTGAQQENPDRLGPLLVVGAGDRAVLVDAGRASAEALRKVQVPLDQVDTVLLTSLLPENVAGLGELYLTGWATPRQAPLRLVGPPGTRALAASLEQANAAARAVADTLGHPAEGARIEAEEVGDGWSEEVGGLRIQAAALPGGPLPALAYRFESGPRSFTVGGTGWGDEALARLAEGSDYLVHEAMHTPTVEGVLETGGEDAARMEREAALHTPAARAGRIARESGVPKLVLVRLRPPPLHDRQYVGLVREEFEGPVLVAEDGDEFTR